MEHFHTWLVRKDPGLAESLGGDDPSAKFRFNTDDMDVAGDYEKDMKDLVKTVMAKYRPEFMRFLHQLIDERGDRELRGLLRKLDTEERSPDPWKPDHPAEPDEVVAPKADRGAEMMGTGS